MRFEIGAGGTIVILLGLAGLSAAVFGLGLVAGHELAGTEPQSQPAVASYAIPAAPQAQTPSNVAAAPEAFTPPPSAPTMGEPPPPLPNANSPAKLVSAPVPSPAAIADQKLNQAMARLRKEVAAKPPVQTASDRIPPAPEANAVQPPPAVNYDLPAVNPSPAKANPVNAQASRQPHKVALSTPPVMPRKPSHEPYSVQIDAVMDRAGAEQMVARLRARGFEPYIVQTQMDGQTWYRVRVGHYDNPDQARAAEAQLHREFGNTPSGPSINPPRIR